MYSNLFFSLLDEKKLPHLEWCSPITASRVALQLLKPVIFNLPVQELLQKLLQHAYYYWTLLFVVTVIQPVPVPGNCTGTVRTHRSKVVVFRYSQIILDNT